MIKQILTIVTAALFLISCAEKEATVKGNLQNAEGETIVLERLSSTGGTAVDSAEIGTDGNYKVSAGIITEAGFYRLSIDKRNFVILLLDNSETTELNANALEFYKTYELTGSEGSEKLKELDQVLRSDFEKTDSLKKAFRAFQLAGHPKLDSIANSIDSTFIEMKEDNREFVIEFINNNPNSLASLSAVQSLSPDRDLEVFQKVADNLSAFLPESDYVKKFKLQLVDIVSRQQAVSRTEIGSVAPELILKTPEGETIKLSDFRGKVTMIDFWASWCKPCRMENPNVVKVYNRFKDKGFEIFGVSLDQKGDKWVEAIAQDGLTWKHGSELKFWQSSFVPIYSLDGIPMTYLLDENGIIIEKGLRGDQLEQKLEELFN